MNINEVAYVIAFAEYECSMSIDYLVTNWSLARETCRTTAI